MANNRHRRDMRQVYFRRRLIAVVVLVLVMLFVFSKCRSKGPGEDDKAEVRDDQEQAFVINPEDNPNNDMTELDTEDDETLDRETDKDIDIDRDTDRDTGRTSRDNQTAEEAIAAQIAEMKDDYSRLADIYYNEESESINFEIKGKLKDSVHRIFDDNGDTSDYDRWEEFKKMVIQSSETVSEEVQTGITLKVLNMDAPTQSILSVKDGISTFDLVED